MSPHDRIARPHEVDRLRLAVIGLIWAAIVISALSASLVSVTWSTKGIGLISINLAILLLAAVAVRWRYGVSPLADIAEGLAVLLLSSLACGAVAMLSLRSGAPMADGLLRELDSALGMSAKTSVEWFATWPRLSLSWLHSVYETSFPQVVIAAVLLPLFGRSYECWRMILIFVGSLLSAAIIAHAVPAMGSYVDASPATLSAMPRGAGTYAFEAVRSFRSGDQAILGLDALGGVITFPSIHTVLALLAIQAWWWQPLLRWPVLILNLLVIVTTIPIGGHYFIDLKAGALLWLCWTCITTRLSRAEPEVVMELDPVRA